MSSSLDPGADLFGDSAVSGDDLSFAQAMQSFAPGGDFNAGGIAYDDDAALFGDAGDAGHSAHDDHGDSGTGGASGTGDVEHGAESGSYFDSVLLSLKSRRRRGGDADHETLSAFCQSLIAAMRDAAREDADLISQNRPAFHRLALLDRVLKVASRKNVAEILVVNGFLGAIADWISFDPRESLPPLDIRSKLVELLINLKLDHTALGSCELGYRLLCLWKYETDKRVRDHIFALCTGWVSEITGQHVKGNRMHSQEGDGSGRRGFVNLPQTKQAVHNFKAQKSHDVQKMMRSMKNQ